MAASGTRGKLCEKLKGESSATILSEKEELSSKLEAADSQMQAARA
jgi:hypothetical protein